MTLLGEASIPLAVFILGGTLGAIAIRDLPALKDILTVFHCKICPCAGLCVFSVLTITKDTLSLPADLQHAHGAGRIAACDQPGSYF